MKIQIKYLSLVEVLVCAAILGILATMVMPLVEIDQIHENEDELRKDLVDIRYALSEYYRDSYEYPCIGDIIAEIKKTNSGLSVSDKVLEPQNLKEILENALMLPRYKDRDRSAMDYDIQSGRMKPYDMQGKVPCNDGTYNSGTGKLQVKYNVSGNPFVPIGTKLMVHITKINATIPAASGYYVYQDNFEAWYEGNVYETGIIDLDSSSTKLFFTNLNDPNATSDDASSTVKIAIKNAIDGTYTIEVFEYPRAPQYIRGSAYTAHYLDPDRKGFFHNPYTSVVIKDNNRIQLDYRDVSWKDWEVGIQMSFYRTDNSRIYTSLTGDTTNIIYYAIGSEIDRTIPNWQANFPSINHGTRYRQDTSSGGWNAAPNNNLSFYNYKFTYDGIEYIAKQKIVDIRYPCIDDVKKPNSGVCDFKNFPTYFTKYFQGITDTAQHQVINITNEDMKQKTKYLWDL